MSCGSASGSGIWYVNDPRQSAACAYLPAAFTALLAAALLLVGLSRHATRRVERYGSVLAMRDLPEESRGTVLQRWLCGQPRCLPVYGSSEMAAVQPTRPDLFFRARQQGFDARVIGQAGDRCLAMLQELAALGPAARGKKIAVFLSPTWFLASSEPSVREHAAHRQFAAVFSPVQAGWLVTEASLDRPLKRRVTTRLLAYRSVVQARSPLLAFALQASQSRAWVARGLFAATLPLLKLQDGVLNLQELWHWSELTDHHAAAWPANAFYRSRRKHPDWLLLDRDVDHRETKREHPTFYSREPPSKPVPVLRDFQRLAAAASPDLGDETLHQMKGSPEWTDLKLLLASAHELGIHLLLMDQPFNGLFNDRQGVPLRVRQKYYERVRRLAVAYQVPLRDFSAHEQDRSFFLDAVHPSARAWVHYDQALSEFFLHKHP